MNRVRLGFLEEVHHLVHELGDGLDALLEKQFERDDDLVFFFKLSDDFKDLQRIDVKLLSEVGIGRDQRRSFQPVVKIVCNVP